MRCWLINGDDTQLLTSIFPKCVKLFVVVVLGEINCVGGGGHIMSKYCVLPSWILRYFFHSLPHECLIHAV